MAAWDPIWDDVFRSRSWGKYPKEELVRFIARRFYGVADRAAVRILDLGCGYGAATWYLAREGFSVSAIDGSRVIIDLLKERLALEGLSAALAVGDIIDLPYPSGTFDCVVDVACLMCNGPAATIQILDGVLDRLKPGGRFFSVTPTDGCWGDGLGERIAECTFRGAPDGPFAGTGVARFSTEAQIRDIYREFAELTLDRSSYTVGGGAQSLSHWIVEGRKG
jgi:SAM-dependent methyltransferase